MSRRAWAFVYGMLGAACLLTLLFGRGLAPTPSEWLTLGVMALVATIAQFLEVEVPGRQSYYPHLEFFFAGVVLLPPSLFVLLVIIPHVLEWIQKRLTQSPLLRDWYIQPFNMSTHIVAGLSARAVLSLADPSSVQLGSFVPVLAAVGGAVAYAFIDHVIIGTAIYLARGISFRESGILELDNIFTDLLLLVMGYIVAELWVLNHWLIIPALAPLLLIYRALTVPRLTKEAQTDEKTGLWNARHWRELFAAELDRAVRFDRPLSLIMADLDLLRNVNNTYGHLAGDVVLAGIGRIIRETAREYDISGRFGGEEFAIVLPETELFEAHRMAERLRLAVEKASFEVRTSPTPIHVTLSLGVACRHDDVSMPDELIHDADVALYQAKLNGRNQVVTTKEVPHMLPLTDGSQGAESPGVALGGDAQPRKPVTPHPVPGRDRTDGGPGMLPETSSGTSPEAQPDGVSEAQPSPPQPRFKAFLPLLVGSVIAGGLAMMAWGLALGPVPDWSAIGLLAASAVLAELFPVDVYRYNTVSVSAGINFAAALIAGLPGVACVSAIVVLVHYLRKRPALYKTGFNWGAHLLAGAVPALLFQGLGVPLSLSNLPILIVAMSAGAIAYYVIETGLVAVAVALQTGGSVLDVWKAQFQWMAAHYMALCMLGLLLGVAYSALGPGSLLIFAPPVFILRYAQKQYVERTESSVRELRRMNEELSRANEQVLAASESIRQMNDELFLVLAKIIDARDPNARGHARQVMAYASMLANELNLPREQVEELRQAALLHDIGKIGIPDQILQQTSALSAEDYEVIKTHPILGGDLLETSQGLRHLAPFVRYHHERWDGQGYPEGLKGEENPLGARILAFCDALDAMAADRPYHKGMALKDIIAELQRCAGTQFDPALVDVFMRIAEREGEHLLGTSGVEIGSNRVQHRARKYRGDRVTDAGQSAPVPVT